MATRFAAVSIVLVVFTTGAFTFLFDRAAQRVVEPAALSNLATHVEVLVARLSSRVQHARGEVQSLRVSPLVQDLVAAQRTSADPALLLRARARLAARFVADMTQLREVFQLRYLDAGDGGREIVRVERSQPATQPRIVADEALQHKGERDYYTQSMTLPQGALYVSKVDLNREHGAIEQPFRPTLRIAAPVFDQAGKRAGILVLNLDIGMIFDELLRPIRDHQLYLVNQEGDYLFHPDRRRTFGFELGKRERIQSDFPGIAPALQRAVSQRIGDSHGRALAIATLPVTIEGGPQLTLIETATTQDLFALLRAVRRSALQVGMAALAISILLALVLARSLTGRLSRLTRAVDAFTHDDQAPLHIDIGAHAATEIKRLADAFARMSRTIEERNRVLDRQQERLRLLVDRAPAAMIMIDREGRIVVANRAAALLFGYERSELAGAPIESLVPERLRTGGADRAWGMPLAEAEPKPGAGHGLFGLRKNGEEVPIEVVLTSVDAPHAPFTLASIVDVRERSRASDWFQRLVEAAPNAKLVVNVAGEVTLVNRAAEKMFGYSRAELLGQPIELLVPEATRTAHRGYRLEFMADARTRAMGGGRDLYARRKDGRPVPVEIGLAPIEGPDGPATLASIIDMTQRKQHEDELKRSNAELQQFAYIASHDLQEPLRMVANYTELLAERYRGQLDAKADKYIHYAVDGARRMQQLVTDLLAYSRVGSQGKPLVPIAVQDVLNGVLRVLHSAVDEVGVELVIGELPVVLADEVQLQQLLQNLIGNALKFRAETAPRIAIRAERAANMWQFSVADNGIGIAEPYYERIFQMFQRLHDRGTYQGSGIGLAISKRIVERHGGRIWVESSPGQGSTFFFTLQAAGA